MRNVPSASINEALNAKQYDLVLKMPTDTFDTYQNMDGYQMLGRPEQSYTYLGFNLGSWNDETNSVDFDAKMANKALRQAMGYAIDNDAIGERFYHGLRSNASTLIPPVYGTLHNSDAKGYHLDMEKANQLLNDAGFIDVGWRWLPRRSRWQQIDHQLCVNVWWEVAQPLADYYVQQWQEIGLDVQYSTGRLIDFKPSTTS